MEESLISLLDSILGPGKSTARGNRAYNCPFCNHSKKKFEVQIVSTVNSENHYHCWSCNESGKTLSTMFRKLNLPRNYFIELGSITKTNLYSGVSKTTVKQSISLPIEFKPLWQLSNSVEYSHALKYVMKRGLTKSEIIKYGIGYCETGQYSKTVIIPSYDATGKLNYFTARSYYDRDDGSRYINPTISRDIVGFELLVNWNVPIVLVEGAFDAMAVRRNAIPLFGKTISNTLARRIIENKVREIYICLDRDALRQAVKQAEQFMRMGITVYFCDLHDKDPSTIGFTEMYKLLDSVTPMDMRSLVEYKLML